MTTIERFNVLGVGVSAVDLDMAVDTVVGWTFGGPPRYVCVTGVHGIMECQDDPTLRAIHANADMVTPDGMPLVWLGKLRGKRSIDRVYGPDLLLAVCDASRTHATRHFFYGGAPGIADRLADRLQQMYPGLLVAGTLCPPFRALTEAEDRAVIEAIDAARPDIVWVGLSTPKQERWMASHVGRLGAPVLIGVGAAFDFHAGVKRQAPRWIQRSGFEWLFRLATEPGRLWRRYARNNPRFLWMTLMQATGMRRFDVDVTSTGIRPADGVEERR